MKAKKFIGILLAATVTVFLSGCMEPIELSKMGIVVGIGIDKYEEGYLMTVQVISPAGVSASNPNLLPVYSMHAWGESLLVASNTLSNMSTQVLFYSHLKAIVIAEDIVREEGINDIVDYIMRNPEIRPDITVLIAQGTSANNVLNVVTAVEQIPMGKLDALTNVNRRRTGIISSFNLYEVMERLHMDGSNIVLNMVSINREDEHLPHTQADANESKEAPEEQKEFEEDKSREGEADTEGAIDQVQPAPEEILDKIEAENQDENPEYTDLGNEGPTKYNIYEITPPTDIKIENLAVFQGPKMVGILNSVEAQSYNLLLGQKNRYWGNVQIDDGQYFASMLITDVKSKNYTWIDERKALVELSVRGELLEGTYPCNVDNQTNLKDFEEMFARDIEEKLKIFLKKTQEEFKSDISAIGLAAYYDDYKKWRTVSADWNDIYPTMDLEVNVTVQIYSTGEIKNYHNLK